MTKQMFEIFNRLRSSKRRTGASDMDVTQLTAVAKSLGIKLTNAKEGSEIFEAWADRVEMAKAIIDGAGSRGYVDLQFREQNKFHEAVRDANAYAF